MSATMQRLAFIFLASACALACIAQPGMPTYESLEWMAADSDLIVRGRIASIEPWSISALPYPASIFPYSIVTFKPDETLAGPALNEIQFTAQAGSYPDESPLRRWMKDKTSLLVFLRESRRSGDRVAERFHYALRAQWNNSFVDLRAPTQKGSKKGYDEEGFTRPADLYTMTGERLTNPDEILARLRAAVAATGGKRVRGAQLRSSRTYVPIDSRLEQLAHEWLASSNPNRKEAAIEALAFFKSPENIALVQNALKDSTTASHDLASDPAGKSIQVREVRKTAKDVLDEWGVGWEPTEPVAAANEMVQIPAGEFTMGSDAIRDAKPARKAYLDAFWIGKTNVTVAQFRAYCKATGYRFKWKANRPRLGWKDNHPMVDVTWYEARAFCKWGGGDLPTEAQWEKAARGGDGRKFPWGNVWSDSRLQCWQRTLDGYHATAPVGSYPSGASPYCCLDMEGNAAQWCLDLVSPSPPGAGGRAFRAIRGDGYDQNDSNWFQCAHRSYFIPDGTEDGTGFRIVAKKPLRLPWLSAPDTGSDEGVTAVRTESRARFNSKADFDGRFVLAARGNVACLWDSESGRLVQRFDGTEPVGCVEFGPTFSQVFTGSSIDDDSASGLGHNSVRVWDVETGREVYRYPSLDGPTLSLDFKPGLGLGEVLVGGSRLWDVEFQRELFLFPGGHAQFCADGCSVLDYSSENHWVAVWDAATYKEVFRVETQPDGGEELFADVSSWGNRLALSSNSKAEVWDFVAKKKLADIGGRVWDVRFTPDREALVGVCENGVIRVFDAATGAPIRSLKGPMHVHEILLSPDGKRCLETWGPGVDFGDARGASLWDLGTGRELVRLPNPNGIVGFAPDGKTLFGFDGSTGVVWSAATGRVIRKVALGEAVGGK